jgi:lipopolysaccharide/colanic/teichoic acid biosynthesis glycosyltransferase
MAERVVTERIGYLQGDRIVPPVSDGRRATSVASVGPRRERLLRALNFVVAAAALVLLLPLMLLIAVAIKLDSPGPILYRQLRVGLDRRDDDSDRRGGRRTADMGGKPFVMYKFRTMQVDAERDSGPVWASQEDDRTTRVGRFLRHYRLDEIPQLWNVLRGEMAVVGPRPERPKFVDVLRREIDEYPRRQKVPPGITGWAQINRETDQSVEDVREKLQYDLDYVERRSVWFDFQIMLRTPIVMLNRDRMLSERNHHKREGSERG